ncbi:MAG TPA: amidohydrolase family protein, partial [Fimbriimonas sp.]|nr:amidohydrolase family protein [Fimbriimonas sp.]
VQALLDAYEEVNRSLPIAATRPCITHSNFMTKEAIDQAARLGVMVDIQPAWLYLDTRTLLAQFGYDRLRYFQPLRTLFEAGVTAGGGSDHMQKIGSLRSINPYDPWLAIWVTLTRRARWHDEPLHPEEALSREQAIRFYTINNARIMFLDDQTGSLEPGKLADFIIIDRDLLTCPVDEIREIKVVATYCGGSQSPLPPGIGIYTSLRGVERRHDPAQ